MNRTAVREAEYEFGDHIEALVPRASIATGLLEGLDEVAELIVLKDRRDGFLRVSRIEDGFGGPVFTIASERVLG